MMAPHTAELSGTGNIILPKRFNDQQAEYEIIKQLRENNRQLKQNNEQTIQQLKENNYGNQEILEQLKQETTKQLKLNQQTAQETIQQLRQSNQQTVQETIQQLRQSNQQTIQQLKQYTTILIIIIIIGVFINMMVNTNNLKDLKYTMEEKLKDNKNEIKSIENNINDQQSKYFEQFKLKTDDNEKDIKNNKKEMESNEKKIKNNKKKIESNKKKIENNQNQIKEIEAHFEELKEECTKEKKKINFETNRTFHSIQDFGITNIDHFEEYGIPPQHIIDYLKPNYNAKIIYSYFFKKNISFLTRGVNTNIAIAFFKCYFSLLLLLIPLILF